MTTIDRILTGIARQHLGISTLDTRRSDSLDFHDVAVWSIAAALKAAFDAGADASRITCTAPPLTGTGLPIRFDDYEIQPCRRYFDADEPDKAFVEPCEPFEADFWTVYGHIPSEGAQAIGDFDTREHAEEVFARITGRSYTYGASHPRKPTR
jgi:hypothetical protein